MYWRLDFPCGSPGNYVCVCIYIYIYIYVYGEGQGSLVCCGPWGREELDMTW